MITSYGIILSVQMGTEKYYLITYRGSSYEYTDMFNTRCPVEKVENYVRMCTSDERQRLSKCINDFDTLYYDSFAMFRSYQSVKDRWDKIKSYVIEGLKQPPLENLQSLYGFPKGRKKNGEKGIDAALREFEEEVGISRDFIRVLGFPPLEERYVGSDGKQYKNVYYRCDTNYMIVPRKIPTKSKLKGRKSVVSIEIMDIEWMTREEAVKVLDPTSADLL